ncbi:MAG: DUF4249 domain-containing protein [Tannerellaceae bacterium]|nr:DUF4249 domain-containing protein [Tannerellaceae bacterium]
MNTKLLYSLFIFPCLLALYGCIEEYEATGVSEVEGILIIEGTILPDSTEIKISKSIGLADSFTGSHYVSGAEVYVERSDGERFGPGEWTDKGNYVVKTGAFIAGVDYRVCVQYDGERYYSDFLSPIITTPVDSISCIKKCKGESVFICVNTHDPDDRSLYYRWSYTENWEVHARVFAFTTKEIINGKEVRVEHRPGTANNIYYCFGRDSSKTLLLASAEKLSENIISEKRLIEMEPTDDRISVLYYIEVSQMQIRKEAYDYFYNLQKNVDQTGGIFSSMPSEMRGNIHCETNPDKPVIGFIEVTTIQKAARYIDGNTEGLYERPHVSCPITKKGSPEGTIGELFMEDPGGDQYTYRRCFDCRTHSKASKNKPWFWPTNAL